MRAVLYVATLALVFTVATVAEFTVGIAHWAEHGSTNVGLGLLGLPPSLVCIVGLVVLLRRRRADRREHSDH